MVDIYRQFNVLSLHLNGTDGSTTITDTSPSPKTLTAFGNAKISTAQSKFGGASGRIDSAAASMANYISMPSESAVQLGSSDFTIRFWARWDNVNATNFNPVFIAKRSVSTQLEFSFNYINGALGFSYSTNGTSFTSNSVSWTPTAGVWYHIALCRSGTNLYYFVDGTQVGTTQNVTGTLFAGTNVLSLFIDTANTTKFEGNIDDFQLYKGVAIYTSNFTPPTEEFSDLGLRLEPPRMIFKPLQVNGNAAIRRSGI